MIPSERLKALHELAAQTRRQEQHLRNTAPPLRSAMPRLIELRIRELRGSTMTPAERAEHQELEREAELDRANDWAW